jgi:hypothetical protein
MAETTGTLSDYRNSVIQTMTEMEVKGVDKQYINTMLYVTSDAAPSDTTIFTVPTGKKLYVIKCQSSNNGASNYNSKLHDDVSDSATGDAKILATTVSEDNATPLIQQFATPIIFEKGITVSGMLGSCSSFFLIEGYIM